MTMDCDEYRQAIGADPGFDGGAEHRSECAACQSYRNEMQTLDLQIRRALELEVPELKTSNVVALADRRRVTTTTWFAVAATVLLAAFVGVRFANNGGIAGNTDISEDELAAEVLAHIPHDPAALQVTDDAVTDEHLHDVVPANIAAMDHSAGLITFAETCPINGNDIPHLVIQGERGPVTILLLPEEKISGAIELNDTHNHGVILPVGDGSVAIIGTKDEKLEQIQEQVLKSVQWST